MRGTRWPLVLASTLLLAACNSLQATGLPVTPTATLFPSGGTGTPPPTQAHSGSPPASPIALSGFGATDAAWEASHTADPNYAAGSAYDPTPGIGPDAAHDDAYFAVHHENGHILDYNERIAPGSSIAAARAAVLRQLPGDAKVLWFATHSTCAQEELASKTLGKALAAPAIGDGIGHLYVEFVTETAAGDSGYDAKNANELIFLLADFPKVSDAPAC